MGWPHGRCSPPLGTGAERVGPGLRWWGQQKTQEGVDMKRLTRSSVIRPQSGPHRLSSLRACRKAPKVLNLILSESPSYSLPSVVHCDHEARCTQQAQLRVLPVSILTSLPHTGPASPLDGMQQASGLPQTGSGVHPEASLPALSLWELREAGAAPPLFSPPRVCSEGNCWRGGADAPTPYPRNPC